jgi:hypothetical protein
MAVWIFPVKSATNKTVMNESIILKNGLTGPILPFYKTENISWKRYENNYQMEKAS